MFKITVTAQVDLDDPKTALTILGHTLSQIGLGFQDGLITSQTELEAILSQGKEAEISTSIQISGPEGVLQRNDTYEPQVPQETL